MNKHFLPYDIYERHRKIGEMINNNDTVLDVGGELNQLLNFCSPKKVVVANVEGSLEKSDVIIKKGKLPFGKNSFTVVCAIDVLEHIPQKERKPFIDELVRVSSEKTILSFPIGTPNHEKYEIELANWLSQKGNNVDYLKEHIKFKLPTKEEIENLPYAAKIHYSGNLGINRYLFKLHMFDPHIKFIRKIIYIKKSIFNFITNPLFYMVLSDKKFNPNVVRAYVLISKNNENWFS